MKSRTICLIVLFALPFMAFPQDRKINIANASLKKEISDYTLYIQNWAKETNFHNYLVVMKEEALPNSRNKYTLGVVIEESQLYRELPKQYTLVNDVPVLIAKENMSRVKSDSLFLDSLKAIYAKNLFSFENYKRPFEDNKRQAIREHEEMVSRYPDSMFTISMPKDNTPAPRPDGMLDINARLDTSKLKKVKVRLSDLKPVFLEPTMPLIIRLPRTKTLIYSSDRLIEKR